MAQGSCSKMPELLHRNHGTTRNHSLWQLSRIQTSTTPAAEGVSSPQPNMSQQPLIPRECSKLEFIPCVLLTLPSHCCSQSFAPRPLSPGSFSPQNIPKSPPSARQLQPKDPRKLLDEYKIQSSNRPTDGETKEGNEKY